MTTNVTDPQDQARRGYALALQKLSDRSQVTVAKDMGVSESTVNRIKAERMEEVILMLAHIGLKVTPASYKCVDPEAYAFLTRTHQRIMQTAPQLIWDQE